MNIRIENVCNISNANISVFQNKLNIKYGNNGVGKTSMSKAIRLSIEGRKLDELTKFGTDNIPKVEFDVKPNSCLSFDENYIEKYLFENDDLLNDTYNLIIKTKDFDKKVAEINNLISNLKKSCKSTNILKLKSDIETYYSEIQFNNDGNLNNKSKFAKGFKNGVTINEKIPHEIEEYANLINSKFNFSWIKWIQEGLGYIMDNQCPFCKKDLVSDDNTKINEVSKFSSSTLMKENLHSKEVVDSISNYLEPTKGLKIKNINLIKGNITNKDAMQLKSAIKSLNDEILKIKEIDCLDAIEIKKFISGSDLSEMIEKLKVKLEVFNSLDEKLFDDLKRINDEIENLCLKINELKKKLIELNIEMSKNISNTKKIVNEFLKISGIPYKVDVVAENSLQAKTILKHEISDMKIDMPKNKLSYGEKNAISLILFALEVQIKNPELVILDDPISSFDSNKKFALMYYLFSSDFAIFREKTILMFTHDFNPIIDFIKLKNYDNIYPNGYLLLNKKGDIIEKPIQKEDILNTIIREETFAKDVEISKISRITHLRRYYELNNCFNIEYEILSSLLHLYDKPLKKIFNNDFKELTIEEIEQGTISIKRFIEDFDYNEFLIKFNDNVYLKNEYFKATNFEKLNIIRVYISKNKSNPENEVCWKFICDTYHVENLTIFGLNSKDFDNIPEYIIKICDHIISY